MNQNRFIILAVGPRGPHCRTHYCKTIELESTSTPSLVAWSARRLITDYSFTVREVQTVFYLISNQKSLIRAGGSSLIPAVAGRLSFQGPRYTAPPS